LPYAPIAHAFAASKRAMVLLLVLGLSGLWVLLTGISWSVTKKTRRSSDRNEYLALHDLLTGLPNRTLFADRAAEAAASAARTLKPVGIAIVDIDRFKEINDTLGHDNGDTYLRHVAAILTSQLRPGDLAARLGGDEFGLVLPDADAPTVRTILERIKAALAVDIDIGGVPVTSEASVGLSYWPTDSQDITDVVQHADLAMHTAKQLRSGTVEYNDKLSHYTPARVALVSELRHGIENNELVLHYQPKLDLRSDNIASVEALLRWQHPDRGLLLPAEFLDIAESTGLIDPLTDWVLKHAVAQAAQWRQDGLTLAVAVNISARNLRDESLSATVLGHLRAHNLPPAQLQIEITETALMADPGRAITVLQQLRDHGVRISLDDFGQGYTSLAQLGKLPLTELKIDRAFVANMLASAHDRTIVNTVIELAHNFGLEVVAEGVETQDILTALTAIACDTAQGWVLTPAIPATELQNWIASYQEKTRANV
jgi:diguanylate cyclase (GGDEF)-like protein